LICIVDDWLLRPRRVIASGRQTVPDAPLMRALYGALPVLLACAVLRLLLAERLDFSAVLLAITVLTGLVWALDAALLAPRRAATWWYSAGRWTLRPTSSSAWSACRAITSKCATTAS